MCCLYGFLHYGNNVIKGLKDITNALSKEATERGMDATGIAFNDSGRLNITKEGKSAFRIDFKHSDKIAAMTGHTRHSTQGSEKKNYNNHPFSGRCRNVNFALAHNGVLMNDKELREKHHLPKTKIETDSYIAVQLLECKRVLNAESIKFMAEALEGSFSFSILDNNDNVWLVKGDSPLHIIHFPKLRLYVYASTEEILWKALIGTVLFDELKSGMFEEVPVHNGDILKIMYGLRRSELMGLKWDAVDFESNTITIQHVVEVQTNIIIVKDSTKNTSSNRVYPLLSDVREILLRIKAQQEEYKKMFGNCYTDTDYVFARPDGKMYYPSYPSKLLKKTLLKNNLKYIRFHDLRHSCASMLIMKGWQMKDISDWLGHADINTTMNIYGHLSMEYKRKLGSKAV